MGDVIKLKPKKKKEKPLVITDTDNVVREDIATTIAFTHLSLLFDLMHKAKEEKRDSISIEELNRLPQVAIEKVVERTVQKLAELQKEYEGEKND